MPRHFLVKRHKHCSGVLSYRDRLLEGQDGSDIRSFPTTIIDTDKHIIIRDGDYISDYGCYGSPDSGYAASPNSTHIGFAREKENLATDRENNNSNVYSKATSVVSSFDNMAAINENISRNSYYESIGQNVTDTPMDLSMPCRKTVLSSVPAYLQQEDSHQQIKKHQQQQQQQQFYHSKRSPNHQSVLTSASAAVVYFDSLNKFYLNTADRSAAGIMRALSPSRLPFNPAIPRHLPHPDSHVNQLSPGTNKTDVTIETSRVLKAHLIPGSQCQPAHTSLISVQKTSSSASPLSSPSLESGRTIEPLVVSGRATPLQSPLPLHSPRRKRGFSDDHVDISSEMHPQDLTKSAPPLKRNDNIDESNTTPTAKRTSAQKAKTTAPALKKNQSSTPGGKKLKAVRRLNFDIDTTSPVSGTIIKDAADFHPDEVKVVYGDIEPSFNFVEVTPEARAELEKIENKIGDYICQLCKEFYEDAFQLAQHRCSRIVHVEYRCPECEKVFNCPANLASHRRWHKPRLNGQSKGATGGHSKVPPVNQKIAPKPDCNGKNAVESGGTHPTSASPVPPLSSNSNNNLARNGDENDFPDEDVKHSDSVLYKRHSPANICIVEEPHDTKNALMFSVLPNSPENTETSVIVNASLTTCLSEQPGMKSMSTNIFSHAPAKSHDPIPRPSSHDPISRSSNHDPIARPSSHDPLSRSTTYDPISRLSTVIAINPLHSTHGSSLTLEEKSLVLQVLNSHSRLHPHTAVTSTVAMVTDGSDAENPSTNWRSADSQGSEKDSVIPHSIISNAAQDTSEILHTSTTSPPPLDLTQASDTFQNFEHHRDVQKPLTDHTAQIECSFCGKQFQRQAYLRKHILSQHGKQLTGVKSEIRANGDNMTDNGKAATDQADQRTAIGVNNCSVCGRGFTSESARIKHESLTHGLVPHLACSTCGMIFTSKAALDKHSRHAHAPETYSCKYCSSTFHSSPGLTRHINKCHPTENRRVILLQLPAARTC